MPSQFYFNVTRGSFQTCRAIFHYSTAEKALKRRKQQQLLYPWCLAAVLNLKTLIKALRIDFLSKYVLQETYRGI